ncbi:LacI family DNA-binding transcriptional regulator [Zongyangia hominis]|nr:LacI family DNA-binding transcriptional regulator [Zongyangia hominis]
MNIRDIAKLCGVGVSTVSRVLNDHPDVNEETKQKVLRVMREHNYVPNNSARNLKRIKSRTIGVVVKGITNPFFSPMIKVIEGELTRRGYAMFLSQADDYEDEIRKAAELQMERRLEGIIFLGGIFHYEKERLSLLEVPFVFATIQVSSDMEGNAYSTISIDDTYEAARATRYLLELGHRRIGVLAGAFEEQSINRLRLEGYLQALGEYGIHYDERLHKNCNFTYKGGYEAAGSLLRETDVTAIFAISDVMAIGAMKAALEMGKKIPEEVAILGFDGLDITAYTHPGISTVRQPSEQMALEAVTTVLDIIEQKSGHRHSVYPCQIIERGSTHPARQGEGPERGKP